MIAEEAEAMRLARAIFADIQLYNATKIAASSSPREALADELAEGRALYNSRVAPHLSALFDQRIDSEWGPAPGATNATAGLAGRRRILLVDGDETFVGDMAAALERAGVVVSTAASSTQVVDRARREKPDLIVVDAELSPTNGWMVCAQLKKDEQLKTIPVVLTSATATEATFEQHRKLKTRANAYLAKPYVAAEVTRVLDVQPEAQHEVDRDNATDSSGGMLWRVFALAALAMAGWWLRHR